MTSDDTETQVTRVSIKPSVENGLQKPSHLMTDKTTTVLRSKLGRRIGKLDDADLTRLNRAMVVFLGFADRR